MIILAAERYHKYQLALRTDGEGCVSMGDYDVQILIKEEHDEEHRHLDGILTLLPEQEKNNPKRGVVVFAHGSGSSGRHSPRNQYVASVINNESRSGTSLVDLLTAEEGTRHT